MPNTLRPSPYYWRYDGVQVEGELRLPLSSTALAPSLGTGSKRWNPLLGREETWNGSEWIATGNNTSGVIMGTYSVNGDGLTSSFSWPHLLGFDPSGTGYTIDPKSSIAQGIYSKNADSTHFYVTYDICPVGTLTYHWTVKQQ